MAANNSKAAQRPFFLFLGIWVLLNWGQAALTPPDPDEAYYWLYAQRLDWGYFDHPPMLALCLAIGGLFSKGALGMRLLLPLMQAGALWLTWRLAGSPAEPRRWGLLFALLLAMPLFQLYGFIAAPDAPLLFFTALFFWAYQLYLSRKGIMPVLLLGFAMAALMYSKYHGVLIVFFTLLSNLRLLRKPSFYAASIAGLVLFLPHLYWQYTHDFPSFRYHLQGRDDVYELKHTITYLVNQLVVFSPLLFPFLAIAFWKRPSADPLERAYKWTIGGFWLFFLWATSKGHVEPQWTSVLCLPLALLAFAHSADKGLWQRWLWRLSLVSIVLMLVLRTMLIVEAWRPAQFNKQFNNREWVEAMRKEAAGKPVVFQNSYRLAAVYTFYTREEVYNFTDAHYRKSQFDIWDTETKLHNQSVLVAGQSDFSCPQCKPFQVSKKNFTLFTIDSLQVSQKASLTPLKKPGAFAAGETIHLPVKINNPYNHPIRFDLPSCPIQPAVLLFIDNDHVIELPASWSITKVSAQSETKTKLIFTVPTEYKGHYDCVLGLRTSVLPAAVSSTSWPVYVK